MKHSMVQWWFCIAAFTVAIVAYGELSPLRAQENQETVDYIHYRLGVKYKAEKKYDQAVDEFRQVLAAYPDNYNAYMHMAEIRMEQKDYRLVIYNLKKALTYNPGWGKAHRMLAQAFEEDGQLQNAIQELQTFQQTCDPAEKDSVQKNIDNLVARVNGETPKEDNAETTESPRKTIAVKDTGVSKTAPSGAKTVEKKAAEAKDEAVALDPKAEAVFKDAVALYDQRQFDKCQEKLKEVLSIQPNHPGAFYYAGLLRRRSGQNEKAKYDFLRALNYAVLGNNAHFYLGKIYGDEKNYKQAIPQLEAYLATTTSDSGKIEAQALLDNYRKLGGGVEKPAGAPGATDTTLVAEAKYPPMEIRIDSMLSMVMIDTLTDAGRKLLAGINAFKSGDFDNAVKEFKKVLAANPAGDVGVYSIYNTGVCYFKMRLFKQAENQFQTILDKFPSHMLAPQSSFLKALSYLERGDSQLAEKLFRDYLQAYRNHEWTGKAFEKLGDAYLDLDQAKKATDAFDEAATHASNPLDKVCALFKLGTTFSLLGNNSRAIDSYTSAIETGEKNNVYIRVPDSYYKIADIKYQQKDYNDALDIYKKVTRKYPSYQETPWGLFQIGSIYKNLEQYQDAVDEFKDLMKRYPEDYWAKQAQWKLDDAVWDHEYRAVLK